MKEDALEKGGGQIKKRYGAPNILITGTPGVGKSKLLKFIELKLGTKNLFNFKFVKLSKVITQKKLYKDWNEEFNVPEFDEDMVIDHLEPLMTEKGGIVLEFHSCSFFPERWFDLIVLLRTENSELYERLAKRKYKEKKITENINCEIHGVLKEEVMSSYRKELILEL
jgi:adenylate kinase